MKLCYALSLCPINHPAHRHSPPLTQPRSFVSGACQSFALAASAELENERLARAAAEGSLAEIQQELAAIAAAEEAARAAVSEEVAGLKAEYDDAMQKLQAAMSKATPRRAAAKKPKVELTEEEKAEKKRVAAEKRKATIARKKKEQEAAEAAASGGESESEDLSDGETSDAS